MEYLKVCVGIDVAQAELVCSFGALDSTLKQHTLSRGTFENHPKGFNVLVKWVKSIHTGEAGVVFVMEATGVYHQKLAHWLFQKSHPVVIVLPNRISNFMRGNNVKTITDTTAADAICQFGLEKQLDFWAPADPIYTQLQHLTRERDQMINERTMLKNQLHAHQSAAFVNASTVKRLKQRIRLLDKQQTDINRELHQLINSNATLKEQVNLITSIPGIGEQTAAVILGETNGFELIRNKRQLTSYAGLDVQVKESGKSVKTKTRISKRGNKYLRKAMYFPAFTAIKHNEQYKTSYARLVAKSGIRMKAAVSIQRKLLELSYIIHKTKRPFDPLYHTMKELPTSGVSAPSESGLCRFN